MQKGKTIFVLEKVHTELSNDTETAARNRTQNVCVPEFFEASDGERTDCWVRKTVVQQLQGVNGWQFGPSSQQAHHLRRVKMFLVLFEVFFGSCEEELKLYGLLVGENPANP